MAGLISEATVGQSTEFLARLGRKGFGIEHLKRSLGDDAMIERMVVAALTEPTRTFPIWRTVTIGGKTAAQLIAELESKGFKIGSYARSMMESKDFTVSSEPREIKLVRPTVEELGLPEGATTQEVWDRAQGLRLSLCPAETGPHLRLADADQPADDWYWVGMKPITGAVGYPSVFLVGHGDHGRWLHGFVARPGDLWDPGNRLVFVASGK